MADTSPEGKALFKEFVHDPARSLLCVMEAFPSARPTLGVFFASVSAPLQPRAYSISSSPKAHPEHVHVTCAVVEDALPFGRVHKGVASNFLKATGLAHACRLGVPAPPSPSPPLASLSASASNPVPPLAVSHARTRAPRPSVAGHVERRQGSCVPATLPLPPSLQPRHPGRHGRPRDRHRALPGLLARAGGFERGGSLTRGLHGLLWVPQQQGEEIVTLLGHLLDQEEPAARQACGWAS